MEEIKAGYENVRLQDGDGNKITSTGGALNISGSISFAEEAVVADGGSLPAKVKVIGGFDGTDVQAIQTDSTGGIEVGGNTLSAISYNNTVIANIDTNLTAVALGQQSGAQKTQLVDAAGDIADVKLLSVNLSSGDKGLVTNTIIHGETTGGGGGYVDVKVTPSGALTTESTLAGLDGAVLGQRTMANSLPVTIASNQTAIPITDNSGSITVDGSVSVSSSALPAGAATESTLQAVAKESTLQSVGVNVLLTYTEVSSINAKTPALGQTTMTNSTPVVIASNQSNIPVVQGGRTAVNLARIDYSSTNVTTAAYTQLLASTSAAVNEVEIFDSSGQTLFFSTGSAGSESNKIYIIPGGNGRIPLSIAAGTRVAIKAVSATANAGEISVNFYS